MSRIIAIHSFRRGTGKSSLAANIVTLLALSGRKAALIDMDWQAPSQTILFGLPDAAVRFTLNDFLWGNCEIEQTAVDLSPYLSGAAIGPGRAYLIPSSQRPDEIARTLRGDYYINLLNDGFEQLTRHLNLDVILIDTHAGLGEETLLAFGISDTMAILLTNDPRDLQGTAVTVDVVRKLEVPRVSLIVNQVSQSYLADSTRKQLAQTYGCDVIGMLPYSPDVAAMASQGIFALRKPGHPFTLTLQQIAFKLI